MSFKSVLNRYGSLLTVKLPPPPQPQVLLGASKDVAASFKKVEICLYVYLCVQ